MKKYSFFILIFLLILMVWACGPEAKPITDKKPDKTETALVEEWVIVDHKNKDFGMAPPDWVTKAAMELEATDKYKNFYVFIIDQSGKDLQGLELWAKGFSAANEISRMVSNRIQNKFVGAAAGDKDMLETYMEQVIKSVSEASFAGMRTEDQYWIKKQNKANPKTVEYRYLFLITVPRDQIDAAIDRAFGDAAKTKPKTEEEKSARDRVKEAFSDGM